MICEVRGMSGLTLPSPETKSRPSSRQAPIRSSLRMTRPQSFDLRSAHSRVSGNPEPQSQIQKMYTGSPLSRGRAEMITLLPQPVVAPFRRRDFGADPVGKRQHLHVLGRGGALIGEAVPFALAAEGAALGDHRVVGDHALLRGVGDRVVGTEFGRVLADALHHRVVAELYQPLAG